MMLSSKLSIADLNFCYSYLVRSENVLAGSDLLKKLLRQILENSICTNERQVVALWLEK
jgi:hypothetical protein